MPGAVDLSFFLGLAYGPFVFEGLGASAFARHHFWPPIGLPFLVFDWPRKCPFCLLVAFSYLEFWLYLVGFGLGKFMRTQSLVCIFLMKCCTPWPGFLSLAGSFLSHSLPPRGFAFRSLIETLWFLSRLLFSHFWVGKPCWVLPISLWGRVAPWGPWSSLSWRFPAQVVLGSRAQAGFSFPRASTSC